MRGKIPLSWRGSLVAPRYHIVLLPTFTTWAIRRQMDIDIILEWPTVTGLPGFYMDFSFYY